MLPGIRRPKRTAVFISGGGSTLQSLLEFDFLNEIRLVVSNRKNALGLCKAKRFGKPTKLFSKGQSFVQLSAELKADHIEQIFLAGFMKIIPPEFVQEWRGKIFNIHPSLLPSYPGLDSFEKSFSDKAPTGVTIHEVDEGVDQGRILFQQGLSFRVLPSESLETATWKLRRTEQHLLREFLIRKAI